MRVRESARKRELIESIISTKQTFDALAPAVLGPEWEVVRHQGTGKALGWLSEKTGCDMRRNGFNPFVARLREMAAERGIRAD